MGRYKRSLLVIGVVLLGFGAYALISSNLYHSYQSTFSLGPGRYFRIPADLRQRTLLTGQFQEASGRLVTFRIMSGVQFASFEAKVDIGDLYAIQNVSSSDISFLSTATDTYYLVFLHGPGLFNTTETVAFQRRYLAADYFPAISGGMMMGLAFVHLYWGLQTREPRTIPPPPRDA